METVKVGDVAIDRCTACHGIWFDASEREALLGVRGAEAIDSGNPRRGREMNEIRRIDCPRCNTLMIRMVDLERSEVQFEQCAACGGNFLDAGEFRELKRPGWSHLLRELFDF